MAKKYCSIYSKLVKNEGDMVGHIAYSLYKAEKVQYIKEQKKTMKVDVLPEKVVQEFYSGRDNQKSLEHYRGMAETILQKFIGGSFDDMSGQVIDEVTNRLTQHMDNSVLPLLPQKESSWKRFWGGVAQSMVGTVVLAFIVWGLVSVVSKHSIEDIFPTQDSTSQAEQIVPSVHSASLAVEVAGPTEVIAPAKVNNKYLSRAVPTRDARTAFK